MDAFVIQGGARLSGRVVVNGAKNAALPLMAAALLTDKPVTLLDVPRLSDITSMEKLLSQLGCEVDEAEPRPAKGGAANGAGHTHPTAGESSSRSLGRTLRIAAADESASHARYEIVRTMRASICVLGPMLARRGEARISMPGGCAIGDRPVDLHIRGLRALSADITLSGGDIIARAPIAPGEKRPRLVGARVFLGGPFGSTVLGTANVMSAATLARGRTVIECAACEPEIVDLAELLCSMGARISGAGTPRITIDGVEELSGASHRVIPDRIEAGTLMMAAAITNGQITIENCPVDALMAVTDCLEHVGLSFRTIDSRDLMRATVEVACRRTLSPVQVTTQPHPGFPTDLQAQLMALLTLAEGNSVVTEKIFPERFLHVAELARMGAGVFRQGPTVVISGVKKLVGAPVMASDLRASAGLVLAGMGAEGTTIVNRVYHIDRGYERLDRVLRGLGARIDRVDEKDLPPQGESASTELPARPTAV